MRNIKCYKQNKDLCWGKQEMAMVDGQIVSSCSGHVTGAHKKPRVCVKIIDADIMDRTVFSDYLHRFVSEELGEAMFYIYGDGLIGEIEADLLASANPRASVKKGEPTHLFVVVDVLKDDMSYMDILLSQDVVVNTVTI